MTAQPSEYPLADRTHEPTRTPRVARMERVRAAVRDPAVLAATSLGIFAAALYLWNLTASGYANTYYSAAALAASQNWGAWFFGSLDAGNFITVDKPPLATMLMGLSVRLFGMSSGSILVPEALMGVASVLVLFAIVRRQFGLLAGTIAGFVMAITPVAVLIFRYDHPDALMTLLMLLGAFAVQRAIENGRHRWLIAAGVALGLCFLSKYLQGFLVGPALVLAYFVAANAGIRRRIAGLLVLGTSTLATAGAWIAVVELTPASMRPFIGGSTNNSVLDLVFGYDGLGRIFGGSGGNGGGANFSGAPGLLRLFNSEFGGQIAWLLPFAFISLAVGLVLSARARRTDLGRAGYLMWGGWLVVHAVVFSSMSGIVHSYYAVAMAPAVAALTGAGFVAMWNLRARFFAGGLPLAGAVAVTSALSALLLARSPDFLPWLGPVVLVGGLAVAAMIAMPMTRGRIATVIGGAGLVLILAAPAASSLATASTAYSGSIVSAGPSATVSDFLSGSTNGGFGGPGGGGFQGGGPGGNGSFGGFPGGNGFPGGTGGAGGTDSGSSSSLADYLLANRGSATWIVAVSGAQEAAELELSSGAPVMAMGGWSGSDNALTLDQLKADVADGSLRYVLVGGDGFGGGGRGGSSNVTGWIEQNGTAVTAVDGVSGTLYDLSGAASR